MTVKATLKPTRWGLQRGLISPEWQEFWRSAQSVIPLWERSGNPRDMITRDDLSPAGGPLWIPEGMNFQGSNESISHPDRSFGQNFDDITFTFAVRTTGTTRQSIFGAVDGNNLGVQCRINGNTDQDDVEGYFSIFCRAATSGTSTADTGQNMNVTDGQWHIVTVTNIYPTTIQFVVDGIQIANNVQEETLVGVEDFGYDMAIGARMVNGSISEFFDGDIGFFAIHSPHLPFGFQKSLRADIFGAFRPVFPVVGKAPAAGGAVFDIFNPGIIAGAAQ